MKRKYYAVWGIDRSYRYLWVASLAAGVLAAKKRYSQVNEK